jgi:transposase
MTKPLSPDLRDRIIKSVEDGGLSRRAAADRFGVAPSTVVEYVRQFRASGHCDAKRQGGDRRSGRIEAHADEILAMVGETPDITLSEIAERLLEGHGERFVPSVIWRFLDRRRITFKKNRARQRAGTAGRGSRPRRLARAAH